MRLALLTGANAPESGSHLSARAVLPPSHIMALETARPTLTHEEDVWVIRVQRENGKVQEYRCASESQAKALFQVLAPKPEAS
ncbi:MAG: hypothetical protein AMXMBFR34_14740 [Myxococcaceae bacterium]